MANLEGGVSGIVGLLAAAVLVSAVADRIGVPYVVALLIVASPIDLPAIAFGPALLFVFLPALVFEAAWNIDAGGLTRRWLAVAVLAVPGVLITAGLVGAGLALTGQLPFVPALLLGAILAATDPIAVIAVFRRLRVPEDLATIVEGESLFNDGAAIVLYDVVVGMLTGAHAAPTAAAIAWAAVSVSLGGAAVGAACAALTVLVLRGGGSPQLHVVGTLVAAFGAYLVADRLHLSGIFAAVVVGIGLRAFPAFPTAEATIDVDAFWSVLAFLANALVFALMGLRIEFARIVHEPVLVLLTLGLVSAARVVLAYVALPLARVRLEDGWRPVIALSGMRGALSVALVIGLPPDIPDHEQLVDTVFGVVFVTLVAQGLTIGPLISRLRFAASGDAGAPAG